MKKTLKIAFLLLCTILLFSQTEKPPYGALIQVVPLQISATGTFEAAGESVNALLTDKEPGIVVAPLFAIINPSTNKPAKYVMVLSQDYIQAPPVPSFIFETVIVSEKTGLAVLRYLKNATGSRKKIEEMTPISKNQATKWIETQNITTFDKLSCYGFVQGKLKSESITLGTFSNIGDVVTTQKGSAEIIQKPEWADKGALVFNQTNQFIGLVTKNQNKKLMFISSDVVLTQVARLKSNPQMPGIDDASDTNKFAGKILNIAFGTSLSDTGKELKDPNIVFNAEGLRIIYVALLFDGMQEGLSYRETWHRNGVLYADYTNNWKLGTKGSFISSLKTNENNLPTGNYEYTFMTQGKVLITASFTLQQGKTVVSKDGTVSCKGRVIDAETKKNLPNASITILKPGVKITQFLYNQNNEMIVAFAISDSLGSFTFNERLTRGVRYTIVVVCEGYSPLAIENGLIVPKDQGDPLVINIPLKK